MTYYYAFHSASNTVDFDCSRGYGVSAKSADKLSQVNIGDFVFVIQNVHQRIGYQLCGLYRIEEITDVGSNYKYPHRVALSDVSKLAEFIPLNRHALSQELPEAGKEGRWDRFMNHFARQGRSFQKPLDESVVALLMAQLKSTHEANEDIPTPEEIEFNDRVAKALAQTQAERLERLKKAPVHPLKKQVTVWRYDRNPDVVAEVLARAGNSCESCRKTAPFKRTRDGSYYLEVHHIIPLSEKGEDSVQNAIALCPNCHRQEHFGPVRIDKNWRPDKH